MCLGLAEILLILELLRGIKFFLFLGSFFGFLFFGILFWLRFFFLSPECFELFVWSLSHEHYLLLRG